MKLKEFNFLKNGDNLILLTVGEKTVSFENTSEAFYAYGIMKLLM